MYTRYLKVSPRSYSHTSILNKNLRRDLNFKTKLNNVIKEAKLITKNELQQRENKLLAENPDHKPTLFESSPPKSFEIIDNSLLDPSYHQPKITKLPTNLLHDRDRIHKLKPDEVFEPNDDNIRLHPNYLQEASKSVYNKTLMTSKRMLMRNNEEYHILRGPRDNRRYNRHAKRMIGPYQFDWDPGLENRMITVGTGAQVPLSKLQFEDKDDEMRNILQYGIQNVSNLSQNEGEFRDDLRLRTTHWIYITNKIHEKFANTSIANRLLRRCSVDLHNNSLSHLPVDGLIKTPLTTMRFGDESKRNIFRNLDPDHIPNQVRGYSYILKYHKAGNLLKRTLTNRLENCHIFLVKPNFGQMTAAVLHQNPKTLTIIEQTPNFHSPLESIIGTYKQNFEYSQNIMKEAYQSLVELRREKGELGENEDLEYVDPYTDEIRVKSRVTMPNFPDKPCPVYLIKKSPRFCLRNLFESNDEEKIENWYPNLKRSWFDEPPKAQILLMNASAVYNQNLLLFRHWEQDISNRTGIFKYGRVPITLVTNLTLIGKMTSIEPNANSYGNRQRNRSAYSMYNYYNIENVTGIARKTYHSYPSHAADPIVLSLTPKKVPAWKASKEFFKRSLDMFWRKKEHNIRSVIRSDFLRNELGKDYRTDHFSRMILNLSNVVDMHKSAKEINPDEFCDIMKNMFEYVPLHIIHIGRILQIKRPKNLKEASPRLRLETIKIISRVKYPVKVAEYLNEEYADIIKMVENERPYNQFLHLSEENDEFRKLDGLSTLPRTIEQFEDDIFNDDPSETKRKEVDKLFERLETERSEVFHFE